MGESSLPSVIVSICDDRDNTFKTTDEGVFGLKNGIGKNDLDPFKTEASFGITGVGSLGPVGGGPSSPRPRIRMCSDGGLTIDSSTSLSSTDDEESDNDDLPSSDDDSGFGFAGIRGALGQASSSSGAVTKPTAVATGDAVRTGHDVAVPVRFTVPLTASLEIVWEAILCRKALIVPRLPPNGAAGSKESLIQLLEFAEDQLGCESVFICLPKADVEIENASFAAVTGSGGRGPNATSTLVRMFSFLGFTIVDVKDESVVSGLPSIFRSTPQLAEGTVVQYDIDESDF